MWIHFSVEREQKGAGVGSVLRGHWERLIVYDACITRVITFWDSRRKKVTGMWLLPISWHFQSTGEPFIKRLELGLCCMPHTVFKQLLQVTKHLESHSSSVVYTGWQTRLGELTLRKKMYYIPSMGKELSSLNKKERGKKRRGWGEGKWGGWEKGLL